MNIFLFLLAHNAVGHGFDDIAGHEDVFRFKVSVQDLVLVQVPEGPRGVECAEDALPAVRVCRDNLVDGKREGAVRDVLCHKAVVLLRDERPIELHRAIRLDLLEDVGLLVELLDGLVFHEFEL